MRSRAAPGIELNEPEQVLVRIAEAHPTPDPGLEEGRRTREVERDHALVLVPDVDHPVDVLAGRRHLEASEQIRPVVAQANECLLDRGRVAITGEHRADTALVDQLGTGRFELRVPLVLEIPEHEDDLPRLARLERQLDVVRAARRPAVRDRVARASLLDGGRPGPAAIRAEERLTLRVEADRLLGAGEVGEVVAPLAVLALVVDDTVLHLDLAHREVALEVRRVVPRIPETELDGAEEREARGGGAVVHEPRPPQLECLAERDEVESLDLDTVATRPDDRVPEPVPAAVLLEVALSRLPGRRPEVAGLVVANVEIAATGVRWNLVVAIARQPTEARVADRTSNRRRCWRRSRSSPHCRGS